MTAENQIVDERTPGTRFLGRCLNCSQEIGQPHLQGCEFTTGEDDPSRHGGFLGAAVGDRIPEDRLRNVRAWAFARLDTLSGATVIVSAIDELLELRAMVEKYGGAEPEPLVYIEWICGCGHATKAEHEAAQ